MYNVMFIRSIYTSYHYLLCNLLTWYMSTCPAPVVISNMVLSYSAQWYFHILSAVNIGSTSVDLIAVTLVVTDLIVVTLQLVAADLHTN